MARQNARKMAGAGIGFELRYPMISLTWARLPASDWPKRSESTWACRRGRRAGARWNLRDSCPPTRRAVNGIGDGLRDALDRRIRDRRRKKNAIAPPAAGPERQPGRPGPRLAPLSGRTALRGTPFRAHNRGRGPRPLNARRFPDR